MCTSVTIFTFYFQSRYCSLCNPALYNHYYHYHYKQHTHLLPCSPPLQPLFLLISLPVNCFLLLYFLFCCIFLLVLSFRLWYLMKQCISLSCWLFGGYLRWFLKASWVLLSQVRRLPHSIFFCFYHILSLNPPAAVFYHCAKKN